MIIVILSSKPLLMEGTVLITSVILSEIHGGQYPILVQWAAINFYPVGTTVKRLFIDFVGSLIIMDSFVSD